MSEIQANFVVNPVTAQIVYSTGQINFTPTTNQLTISTGSAPAAAAPLNSVQYNENGLLQGDGAFYYANSKLWVPNVQVSGTTVLNVANVTTANISNVTYMRANVANVHLTGGLNGYVLVTDGTGNLTWNPENTGSVRANIKAVSNATPIVMTVANTTPYINSAKVTISGVLGANANTIVNGQDFYVQVANNFATTGNVSLYTDANLTIAANGTFLTATANTGVAVTYTNTGGGGGNGSPGGINGQIQFNEYGAFGGNAGFTFDTTSGNVGVPGNLFIAGNVTGNFVAAGSNTQIQYNNDGIIAADAGLTFDNTSNALYVSNEIVSNAANIGGATITNFGISTPGYYGNITGANVISGRTIIANANVVANLVSANLISANTVTFTNIISDGGNIGTLQTAVLAANLINPVSNNLVSFDSNIIAETITTSSKLTYSSSSTVTQTSARTNSVTLNSPSGRIVLFNGACGANTTQTFTLVNSFLTTKSMVLLSWEETSYLGSYTLEAMTSPITYPSGGNCKISIRNVTSSSLTEQPVIRFLIVETNI